MSKNDTTLRNTIIGTVVGGLILSFILWLTDFLVPLWNSIKGLFFKVLSLLTYEISIPLWGLISIIIAAIIILKIKPTAYKRTEKELLTIITNASTEKEKIELNDLESRIIAEFARADGHSFQLSDLARRIRSNNLRTEQALNSLIAKSLLEEVHNYFEGTFYFLTEIGKNFVIERDLA